MGLLMTLFKKSLTLSTLSDFRLVVSTFIDEDIDSTPRLDQDVPPIPKAPPGPLTRARSKKLAKEYSLAIEALLNPTDQVQEEVAETLRVLNLQLEEGEGEVGKVTAGKASVGKDRGENVGKANAGKDRGEDVGKANVGKDRGENVGKANAGKDRGEDVGKANAGKNRGENVGKANAGKISGEVGEICGEGDACRNELGEDGQHISGEEELKVKTPRQRNQLAGQGNYADQDLPRMAQTGTNQVIFNLFQICAGSGAYPSG